MAAWPYNTARWQKLRSRKLKANPLCEPCKRAGITKIANTVDHDLAINQGGEAFPPIHELTSMCPSCHGAKTARGPEAGAAQTDKPRRGCDVNGIPLDPRHPWNDMGGTSELDRAPFTGTRPDPLLELVHTQAPKAERKVAAPRRIGTRNGR